MVPVPQRVEHPPARLHVLFDGDCGFCRFWIERWKAQTREPTLFEPYQEAGARYPEIPTAAFAEAVQVVDREGKVYSGADAVFRLLKTSGWRWLSALAKSVPAFLSAARRAYAIVARNRTFFSTLTRLGWGHDARLPTYAMSRRVFAQGLGGVFFIAFWTLAMQWRGLFGSVGISPLISWMGPAREHYGAGIYWQLPSVFWLRHGDTTMALAVWLGVLISLAMACGFAPGLCALVLWGLYLSFCTVSEPFFNFQWDGLLLETALLAAIYLPWTLRPQWRLTTRLTTLGRWLLWWLLCRLMLESGIVKLASGDPTWHNLTALTFHYETQPLPLPTAWLAHQAPVWFHKLEALATFAIEFLAPPLIFAPRRLRHAAAWAMIALQFAIMFTGNYAFFNLLCILLALLLFEDTHWPVRWRTRLLRRPRAPVHDGEPGWASRILEPVGVLSALIAGALLCRTFSRELKFPGPVESLVRIVAPLRSINSYGLFASMTTARREIVIEGSLDGETWQAYEFKWKPGDLNRAPGLVEPYQPRLDWQMWFAALSEAKREPWLIQFMVRLLQNQPEVLDLINWNPFPGTPPKYVRALFYDYHFTKFGEGPAWWTRELLGAYTPPLSIPTKEERAKMAEEKAQQGKGGERKDDAPFDKKKP